VFSSRRGPFDHHPISLIRGLALGIRRLDLADFLVGLGGELAGTTGHGDQDAVEAAADARDAFPAHAALTIEIAVTTCDEPETTFNRMALTGVLTAVIVLPAKEESVTQVAFELMKALLPV
jgi:hypothetical protein